MEINDIALFLLLKLEVLTLVSRGKTATCGCPALEVLFLNFIGIT